jgi:hypothetical protein
MCIEKESKAQFAMEVTLQSPAFARIALLSN